MPIYEYQCQACGERHDALQKFSDGPLRKCPACGKLKLKKLVSAAAFHLKGTGWYVTDFRDKPKGKEAASKDTGTTDTAAKDSSGSAKSGDASSDSGSEKKDTKKKDAGSSKTPSAGAAAD